MPILGCLPDCPAFTMQEVWFQFAVDSSTGILGIGYLPKNVYTMKKALAFDSLCYSARINNDALNECTMIAIEQKTSGQKKKHDCNLKLCGG